jgi:hypothetical protein
VVTGGTEIFFAAEAAAFAGIWQTDARGQLVDLLKLPVAPTLLGLYGDKLVALARNRLYVIEREPLRLTQTLLLGTASPARMLIDAGARRAYVTATRPSALIIQELP